MTIFNKYRLEFAFATLFALLSVRLNLQFLEGSNINTTIAGHDEYIAVKEVYSILHPISLKHFFMAVVSGNVLYYGRSMFYIDAIVAYLPFKIWGVTGMVMSVRMMHALILLISLIILGNTFLKTSWQKLFFYAATCLLYYTLYFIMMPKPEPYQLFFLALFLQGFKKTDWAFGRHFIWVGIAYGLKFNVLLLIPLFFVIPLFNKGKIILGTNLISGIKSFGYMIVGILISIPCLILTPIRPIFLKTYLHETFGGTIKGYDDSTLTVIDWIQSGLGGSYLGYWILAYPFILVVIWVTFISIRESLKSNDFSVTVLLVSGIILTLVIMLNTKRLWPHYIWTGYIMMMLGLIASFHPDKELLGRKIAMIVLLICSLSSLYFSFCRELPLYLSLSNQKEAIRNSQWSRQTLNYIKTNYPNKRVGTDGSILYAFKDFLAVNLYHPFEGKAPETEETKIFWYGDQPQKIWDDSNDLVVFYKRLPERMLKEHSNVFVGRHEELNQLFMKRTNLDFVRDTSFGEIIIFRRK